MFSFSEFLENVRTLNSSDKFAKYIESCFSELETFFLDMSAKELNNLKFDFEDLMYDLIDNKLIMENNKTIVDAFLILLAEQFEQANLINAIKLIYDYIPESAIKYRLKASMLYLKVNNLTKEYHDRFFNILDLMVKSEEFEEYHYKVIKSVLNYFFTAMEQFSRVQDEKLAISFKELFIKHQVKYKILSDLFIQDTIKQLNINNYTNTIDTIKEQLDTKFLSNISCDISEKNLKVAIENGIYADTLYSLTDPSFHSLKEIAVKYIDNVSNSKALYSKLNRGRNIITDEALLYQYIFSYSSMHKVKLYQSFEVLLDKLNHSTINVIDWGCGQALATILLIEYIKEQKLQIDIDNITLIEPSKLALSRGLLHVNILKQKEYKIKAINKNLDCLKENDVAFSDDNIVLHLFSNILDIEFFKLDITFLEKISHNIHSNNYFVCVSPNINPKRNNRLDLFYKYFDDNFDTELFSSRDSDIGRYTRYEKVFKVKYTEQKKITEAREIISSYHVDIYTKLTNYKDLIEPTLNVDKLRENIENDPDYVIFKIRKIAEIITSKIFINNDGENENNVSQNDKIRYLSFEKKVLSRKAQSHLHTIRTIGNIGIHEYIENPTKMLKDDAYFLATALVLLIEDLKENNLI